MASNENLIVFSMKVNIPCSGHAPLIIDELKKEKGVEIVRFKMPNIFTIGYNLGKTNPQKISSLEIFKTFMIEIKN